MPRREDHEVRQGHVGHWIKKKVIVKDMHFIKLAVVDFAIYRNKCGSFYQSVSQLVCEWALRHKVATPSFVQLGPASQCCYSVLCES